jgi:hypothetical protein
MHEKLGNGLKRLALHLANLILSAMPYGFFFQKYSGRAAQYL